jgi:site-specific DNA-methyltransferase (adenine-specific)
MLRTYYHDGTHAGKELVRWEGDPMKPYYQSARVTLYHGDARDVLPHLVERPVSCVTDPPYGETHLAWDRWPSGWVASVGRVLPKDASLWCFGSLRLLLEHSPEFVIRGWKLGQEVIWEKANGSGPSNGRFRRVHELAVHWYRGKWSKIHHEIDRVPSEKMLDRSMRRREAHRAPIATPRARNKYQSSVWTDDGFRQMRSVIRVPSVRFQKRHPTEKPEPLVRALVVESTPLGQLVVDPFCGSGTTGEAAILSGRRALLIEVEERSCEETAKRLEKAA